MNKFKVGDKVRIKEDLKVDCEYDNGCCFVLDMEKVGNCEYLMRGMLDFIEYTNKEKNLEKKGENNDAL